MDTFSPSSIIVAVGKTHNLNFSETGSGEGWNSGHGEKDWHYFSATKTDNLENVVKEIYAGICTGLTKRGADIHGNSEATHAFVVYGLNYTQGGREGAIKIVAADLENGTAVDVFLDEHPK